MKGLNRIDMKEFLRSHKEICEITLQILIIIIQDIYLALVNRMRNLHKA